MPWGCRADHSASVAPASNSLIHITGLAVVSQDAGDDRDDVTEPVGVKIGSAPNGAVIAGHRRRSAIGR